MNTRPSKDISANAAVPALLTFENLCRIFGCCRRTVENLHAQKQIPPGFLVGRRRYWRATDIQQFIDEKADAAPMPKKTPPPR